MNNEKKVRAESVTRENKNIEFQAIKAGTTSAYLNKLIKGGR